MSLYDSNVVTTLTNNRGFFYSCDMCIEKVREVTQRAISSEEINGLFTYRYLCEECFEDTKHYEKPSIFGGVYLPLEAFNYMQMEKLQLFDIKEPE